MRSVERPSLVSAAPDDLRQQLRGLTIPRLVRQAAAFRPALRSDLTSATRLARTNRAKGSNMVADCLARCS